VLESVRKHGTQLSIPVESKETRSLQVVRGPGHGCRHRAGPLQGHGAFLEHLQGRIQPGFHRVPLQDLRAEAVDGQDAGSVEIRIHLPPVVLVSRHAVDIAAHLLSDAVTHLSGCAPRKGDSDDPAQRHALGEQPEVSAHQRARLARTGAGGYHDVSAARDDRIDLFVAGLQSRDDGWEVYHEASR